MSDWSRAVAMGVGAGLAMGWATTAHADIVECPDVATQLALSDPSLEAREPRVMDDWVVFEAFDNDVFVNIHALNLRTGLEVPLDSRGFSDPGSFLSGLGLFALGDQHGVVYRSAATSDEAVQIRLVWFGADDTPGTADDVLQVIASGDDPGFDTVGIPTLWHDQDKEAVHVAFTGSAGPNNDYSESRTCSLEVTAGAVGGTCVSGPLTTVTPLLPFGLWLYVQPSATDDLDAVFLSGIEAFVDPQSTIFGTLGSITVPLHAGALMAQRSRVVDQFGAYQTTPEQVFAYRDVEGLTSIPSLLSATFPISDPRRPVDLVLAASSPMISTRLDDDLDLNVAWNALVVDDGERSSRIMAGRFHPPGTQTTTEVLITEGPEGSFQGADIDRSLVVYTHTSGELFAVDCSLL